MAAPVPDDVAALKRALAAAELRADQAEAGAVRAEEKATRAEEKAALAVAEAAAAKADRAEDQALIAQHAQWIAANPGARVRLEGHTDERGTREYNIGLGERRAQAVRRALALQGGSDLQVPTVSFGEERPAVAGESEDAFSQNRRVEIVYGN